MNKIFVSTKRTGLVFVEVEDTLYACLTIGAAVRIGKRVAEGDNGYIPASLERHGLTREDLLRVAA